MAGNNVIERVQVVLQAVTNKFKKSMEDARFAVKRLAVNMTNFGQVMALPLDRMRLLNNRFKVMKSTGGRLAASIRRLTHGMKGFRMEMLGVMFFGMMLRNMFMQLLNPVMEAFGVFDLFREMLLMLFLPIMEAIFPLMLQVIEWFINLPDPIKKVIGVLTLVMIAFGAVLQVIGSLGLGIGSLILFGPEISAVFSSLGIIVSGAFLAIAAIVLAVIIGIVVAWRENFGNIRGWFSVFWSGIKDMVGGALDIIMGIIDLFTSLIKGDFQGVLDALGKIWKGIIKLINGAAKIIVSIVVILGLGILRIFVGIGKTIVGFFKWVGRKVKGFFTGLWTKVKKWGAKMVKRMGEGISGAWKFVKDAILGLFPKWARDMIWNSGKFIITIFTSGSGSDDGDSGSSGPDQNDFIWRAGQGAQSINPNDTVVGFKGAVPDVLGGGEGINFSPTFNINVVDRFELQRILDDNNKKTVEDLRRLIKQ